MRGSHFLLAALALAAGPAAAAERIVVDPDVCAYLSIHRPAEDVAYRSGVDADGEPVVPADLDGGAGSIDLGHEFSIPIFARLKDILTIAPDSNLEPVAESEINIGWVTLDGGEVYFNGQRLGSAEENALAAECRRLQDAATAP